MPLRSRWSFLRPSWPSSRHLPAPVLQPLVKFHRASAHVGVRVAGHFQIARAQKNFRPPLGTGNLRVLECHGPPTTVEEWKLNKAIKLSAQAQSPAVGVAYAAHVRAWLGLACVCARDQPQLIGPPA